MIAVYAGSFDPFTYGHLDIIKEASKFFDTLYVLCADNIKKKSVFPKDKMGIAIDKDIRSIGINNVKVIVSSDLTIDVCKRANADYLVRGLRSTSDYIYEEDIAKFNQMMNPSIKTIYFRASNDAISSTTVKELFFRGRDITGLVPSNVHLLMNQYKGD